MNRSVHATLGPVLLLVSACGCELPQVVGVTASDQSETTIRLSNNDDVDVLFVVDNSASMAAKQQLLASAVPALLSSLVSSSGGRGALHFGAVTADLGAGGAMTFGCKPGGDGAALSAVGAGADESTCPSTTDGAAFVVEDFAQGTHNYQQANLASALSCMLTVGTSGCVIQQPLAAAHIALQHSLAQKDGYIRDGALLVIVYLTDGDDCSLPDGSDLFSADSEAVYGPLTPFRCARFGISDGLPPRQIPDAATGGPLPQPAPIHSGQSGDPTLTGKLVDVSTYQNELRLPAASGGIKTDPNDVLVLGLAAPAEPFEIVSVVAGTEKTSAQQPCSDGTNCVTALKHACEASANPALFGDPAVRLQAVIGSVQHSYASPVCSVDQSPALADFGHLVATQQSGPGCLAAAILVDNPQCDVEDVGPAGQAVIPACGVDETIPCWRLVADPSCAPVANQVSGQAPEAPQQYRIDVDRGGAAEPANTITQARCVSAAS